MAEEILYWTELIGLKVYDLKGRGIGTLRDAALVPLIDPVRVDRFLVGAGPGWLSIRYDQVKSIGPNGIHLQDELLTPYHSDEYMLRMVRDLLDQQIIDAQGRKVVRINDITFLKERETTATSCIFWKSTSVCAPCYAVCCGASSLPRSSAPFRIASSRIPSAGNSATCWRPTRSAACV